VQALDPDGDTYPSAKANVFLYTRREPLGVVTVITPWNFPICIAAWKIAPAIAFGNTVVWKPAELVPLTAAHLLRALVDAGLPQGVVNLVLGKGSEVGEVITTHPDVAGISFTGSNAVGRALQAKAAAKAKRVQLELGGKNPAIVLADADLDLAADQVARGAFLAAGQKCTATSRVIVEQAVIAPLMERLSAIANTWKVGDPLAADTIIGPVVSEAQLTTVLGFLDRARSEGARVVAGGARGTGDLADGYFVKPTVLGNVTNDMTVAQEEIFGPVLSVIGYDDEDDAVRIANDSLYGLSGGVWSADQDRAIAVARRMRTGAVDINGGSFNIAAPFGGYKQSGYGRENGPYGIEEFLQTKSLQR
jgi:acyl-CoA reductase-like NAD-dependent aldehyde dehydrogenase